MNILITGGTGFIGSHLLKRLVTHKHKLIVIKRDKSDIWRIKDISKRITFVTVNKLSDLAPIFKKNKIDLIIHLAMVYKKDTDSLQDLENMNYVNIDFPSQLLQLASKYNVMGFINTGTCFEYKVINKPIKETSLICPYNYYAATKLAFEQILNFYTTQKVIRSVTLRLFYPYGEMANKKIIPLMINALTTNQKLEISLGEQRYNYTYIEDIIDAYIKCIDFISSKKYHQPEMINIGEKNVYSLRKIAKILEQISGKVNIIDLKKPYPPNEIMYCSCDNSKAKKLLNWSPKTTLLEGLERVYNSQLNNESNFILGKKE